MLISNFFLNFSHIIFTGMNLYVTKDCEDSLAALVAFQISGIKGEVKIVNSDSKHIPFLKSTKQVPSLQLDSGDFLFTLESIFVFLSKYCNNKDLKFYLSKIYSSIPLNTLNKEIPTKSLFGEDETLGLTDMLLWSKLATSLQAMKATKSLYCNFPRVGFWFDKVSSHNFVTSAAKKLEYTEPKTSTAKVTKACTDSIINKTSKSPDHLKHKKPLTDAIENFLQISVTESEKDNGLKKWNEGYIIGDTIVNDEHPKKPIPGKKNNLITSALPYVNNVPHLGNIIGAVLSADVFARYCRLKNENTLFICGTDEYGTATETKALAEGLTPKEICDKYHVLHRDIYSWFNISFDEFGRTTTKQQTEIAQNIFWNVHNNGYTIAETVEQLYCDECKKFLADRFVEGVCPFCEFGDARGDQCDKCSKLINPIELKNPKCKVCSASPIVKTSRHLFLNLPKLEKQLKILTDDRASKKTYNGTSVSITNSWIKTGLKPRCITRDLKWGTPVPHEEYKDKVFYVWFDAPIGYISITANYMEDWELWWKNPDQVTLHQFMAKDNVPFHSVIFPASLMATQENWTLVNTLDGIDWLQYEGTKFSKSRGTGVFGDQVMETNIPCDIYRCYLILNRPETSDTNFTWDSLAQANNNILLNNLGNFVLRALTFCKNSYGSKVAKISLNDDDTHFIALVNGHLSAYYKQMDDRLMSRAFESVFAISKIGNQYLQYNQPWVLAKGNDIEKSRAGSVIGLATNLAALLSVVISPFMPTISNIIHEQLNMPENRKLFTDSFVPLLDPGHKIGTPFPLFSKLDDTTMTKLKEKFAGKENSSNDTSASTVHLESIQKQIETQGNKVRELKSSKATPDLIKAEVAKLLELKKKLPVDLQPKVKVQGKPKAKPQPKAQNPPKQTVEITPEMNALQKKIEQQGNKIRNLKSSCAEKEIIDTEVKILLNLKSELPPSLQPKASGKKRKEKK